MTRRFSVLLLSLLAVVALAIPALGQQVQVQISLTGVAYDGTYGPAGNPAETGYAGVYQGTLNGVTVPTGFVCDDFLSNISIGDYWEAYTNSNKGSLSGVRFAPGGSAYDSAGITNPDIGGTETQGAKPYNNNPAITQQEEYNMLSYLVQQIFNEPQNNNNEWGALGGAIWSITDGAWGSWNSASSYSYNKAYQTAYGQGCGNGALTAQCADTAQEWVQLAYQNRDDTNLPTYAVYTPFPGGGCGQSTNYVCQAQEFFAQTPEPSALVLLAWGALALTLAPLVSKLRRKRLAA